MTLLLPAADATLLLEGGIASASTLADLFLLLSAAAASTIANRYVIAAAAPVTPED